MCRNRRKLFAGVLCLLVCLCLPHHCPGQEPELPEYAYLGLEVTDVSAKVAIEHNLDRAQGALILKVIKDSPAEQAELLVGDIIMSFDDRKVRTAQEFRNDAMGAAIGVEVMMCISREDYRMSVSVVPVTAPIYFPPDDRTLPYLGVEVVDLEDDSAKGIRVVKVISGSPAAGAEILPGDLIMSFNYRDVRSVDEFINDLKGVRTDIAVVICIKREDIRKTLYLMLEATPPAVIQTALLDPAADTDNQGGSFNFKPFFSVEIDSLILIFITCLAILAYLKNSLRLRYITLILAAVFIGFAFGGGISMIDIMSMINNVKNLDFSLDLDNLYGYTLVLIIFFTMFFIGRFYCGWLCPFGAILALAAYLGLGKQRLPKSVDIWLRAIKYVFLFILLTMVFLFSMAPTAYLIVDYYEPFCSVFELTLVWQRWIVSVLGLILSLVFARFFCRYLCITGAFLSLFTMFISAIKRFLPFMKATTYCYQPCQVKAALYHKTAQRYKIDNGECIRCRLVTPKPAKKTRQAAPSASAAVSIEDDVSG